MNKREYPLFLIDRSKHASYPFDYIACFDREVGFIARVVPFFDDAPFHELIAQSIKIDERDYTSITYRFKQKGGLVVVIEDFLYYFDWTTEKKNRVKTLLKKGLKKYLHAEVERTPQDDLSIENQIRQQQLTVERAKSNYDDLLSRANGDRKLADYQIALSEATLASLKALRDHQKYFVFNFN